MMKAMCKYINIACIIFGGCNTCNYISFDTFGESTVENSVIVEMDTEGYAMSDWEFGQDIYIDNVSNYYWLYIYQAGCTIPRVVIIGLLDSETIVSIESASYLSIIGCPDDFETNENRITINNVGIDGSVNYIIDEGNDLMEFDYDNLAITNNDITDEALPHLHSLTLNGTFKKAVRRELCE